MFTFDFKKTKKELITHFENSNFFTALRAMNYAESFHGGLRKDKVSPEFSHQIWIADYIRNKITITCEILEEKLYIIAFLHDLHEDYNVSIESIERYFGEEVANAVEILSCKPDNMDSFVFYDRLAKCPMSSIIKGIDRLHNMKTMEGVFSEEKKVSYAECTETHVLMMLEHNHNSYQIPQINYNTIWADLNAEVKKVAIPA